MTQKLPQLDIPLSKEKNILLILAAFAFVAGGAWLWSTAEEDTRHDQIYTKIISGACIGFFGSCSLVGLAKLIDRRPGLSLSDRGLKDNSSGLSFGLVDWKDIERIDVVRVKLTKILLIYVTNPSTYLSKMNPLKRVIMKLNQSMYGTPFSISSNSLSCDFSTLYSSIESRINQSACQQNAAHNRDSSAASI